MPVMKREAWLKLTPTEKVVHYAQRTIDRLDAVQKRYDRARVSGKITEPIPFLEQED
jgi:hypothetical protein